MRTNVKNAQSIALVHTHRLNHESEPLGGSIFIKWHHSATVSRHPQPPLVGPPGCEGSCVIPFPVYHVSYVYSLLSLKIPSFGLRISRARSQGSWIVLYHLPPTRSGSGSGLTPESPWKVIKFQSSRQGNKSLENWSQVHPKS